MMIGNINSSPKKYSSVDVKKLAGEMFKKEIIEEYRQITGKDMPPHLLARVEKDKNRAGDILSAKALG